LGANLGGLSGLDVEDEHRDEGTPKRGEPAEEQGEVVAGGGEDGVDAVAFASFEIISVHAVLGLDMADDGLDGGALTGEESLDFVAVLGSSNFTYAEATWMQGLADWIGAHTRAFPAIGGVPSLIVPDNTKTAVIKASLCEPFRQPYLHGDGRALRHCHSAGSATPAARQGEGQGRPMERWISYGSATGTSTASPS
jgi:hypothetical protein